MQLAGELSKISLSSLIQLVRNGALTGEIALLQGTKTATIYVDRGRIVDVESDQGSGREGFLELFLWLSGTFSFTEGPLGDIPRTFPSDEPIDRIRREGVTYLEQKKYLDQLRINGQTVLKPTPAARDVHGEALLDRLDGRRTLAQALSDANLSRREYIQSVHRLLCEGLAVVAEPDHAMHGGEVNLPGWVVSRLKQDNADLSQSIVDMVIWVDRVKCWMYQADADLARLVEEFGASESGTAGEGASEPATEPPPEAAKPVSTATGLTARLSQGLTAREPETAGTPPARTPAPASESQAARTPVPRTNRQPEPEAAAGAAKSRLELRRASSVGKGAPESEGAKAPNPAPARPEPEKAKAEEAAPAAAERVAKPVTRKPAADSKQPPNSQVEF